MKKFVLLAAVAAFAATVIGCGPTANTKMETKMNSNATTQTQETKK